MSEASNHPVENGSGIDKNNSNPPVENDSGTEKNNPDSIYSFIKYYLEYYSDSTNSNLDQVEEYFNFVDKVDESTNKAPEEDTKRITNITKGIREDDFEKVSVDIEVDECQFTKLLQKAVKIHYEACGNDIENEDILLLCIKLFKDDYRCENVNNVGGTFCWNYPENLPVPIGVRKEDPDSSNEHLHHRNTEVPGFFENFTNYVEKAKSTAVARCRSRFPVPVILYKNKYVCRSGTVAVRKGAAFEAARRGIKPKAEVVGEFLLTKYARYGINKAVETTSQVYDSMKLLITGVEEMKENDAALLNMLNIRYICDLMVENRKVHTGMHVSSSEKINLLKYGDFSCLKIPFPGCEFFSKYSEIKADPNYNELKSKLIFDWQAPQNDSALGMVGEELPFFQEINWDSYKEWDLSTLTKNYIRLLLHYLDTGEGGLLVHCISGWDRTPLFISLLRISLWADGLAHKNLSVIQMAYFTVGYDWYLFGHVLPNRLKKKEEVMNFCFKFLPEIASREFSLRKATEDCYEDLMKERNCKIKELSELVLKKYDEALLI